MKLSPLLCIPVSLISIDSHAEVNINSKPNIIIILSDDLGYSDIGCYGSEIRTPNIDRLAENGVRLTQLYNSARCCPTRASLLTGLYPHQVGVGQAVVGGGVLLTGGDAGAGRAGGQGVRLESVRHAVFALR